MKKTTLTAIQTLLTDLINDDPTNEAEYGDILTEITTELNKDADRKQANADTYEAAKPVVFSALSETPVTISELYDEIAENLPEGFTKGKLQYAMTRLWKDEIAKVEGKVNGYCVKA